MKKRYSALILVLLLALPLFACSVKETPAATATPEVAPGEIVICNVNGVLILRSEFIPVFNMYMQYYSQILDTTNEQTLKSLQDSVFDGLVRAEVIRQQAAKQGISLTVEQEQAITEAVQLEYEGFVAQFEALAAEENAPDVHARGLEMFEEALKSDGMTIESYKERSANEMRKTRIMEKLREQVIQDITFTEQDAPGAFATDLEADKKEFTQTPAAYESALANYQSNGGVPPLYIPEGYVRVKHILVDTEETALLVIDKLNGGADFDTLMAEYGTDPGMKTEPNMSEGYLMGADTNFVPEFKAAGLALQNVGDFTAPVKTTHGYHVIKLVEKVESRALTLEEIKDEYIKGKLEQLQNTRYTEQLQKWIDEAEIISYIGRIRDLGKTP